MNIRVAIDGPAGAGKSTVAKRVARRLKVPYIDTGAMYRSVTLLAIEGAVPLHEEAELARLADGLDLVFVPGHDTQRVLLRGVDVTEEIRTQEVGALVSVVAAHARVRECLVKRQQQIAAESPGVVMDGRDIGTHVLPDADVKIFLTASPEARARRRFEELASQGFRGTVEDVMRQLTERDAVDGGRAVAPMRPAPDAVVLDTSALSAAEAVEMIVALCQIRAMGRGGSR